VKIRLDAALDAISHISISVKATCLDPLERYEAASKRSKAGLNLLVFTSLVFLEELNFALMLLGCFTSREGPKVTPLAGLRILFTGVQPILSRFEFANHNSISPPSGTAC
jgi:hypothetical protein